MFGRFIGKISSLRTATLRRFFQKERNGKASKNKKKVNSQFPVSIDSFNELVEPGNIFVDKSLLIKRLLDSRNKAMLFTRPRRWGKSLNIDMLEIFFQADVDEVTGIPNFKKQSQKSLFKKLNIAKEKISKDLITGKPTNKLVMNFQGQFPVIKLLLRDPVIKTNEDIVLGLQDALMPVFKKHRYILKSRSYELMDDFINEKKISSSGIGRSLGSLINALYEHYNRKVVLLIDEYDRNITSLFQENSEFYSNALELLRSLFDPIKNNEKLLFTVFTGASKMVKAGIFTGLNHYYYDSVTKSKFSEFFGFTESEIDSLIEKLISLKPDLSKEEIKVYCKEIKNYGFLFKLPA